MNFEVKIKSLPEEILSHEKEEQGSMNSTQQQIFITRIYVSSIKTEGNFTQKNCETLVYIKADLVQSQKRNLPSTKQLFNFYFFV